MRLAEAAITILVACFGLIVMADDPVRTEITTSGNREDRIDLRDKYDWQYQRLDSGDEDDVFGGSGSVWDRVACDYKRVGAAFKFKSGMRVHEVVVEFPGSTSNDWDDGRTQFITVGNNAGHNDNQFGPSAYQACSATDGWSSDKGVWTIRDSSMSRTGRYVSILAKSNDCDCDDRRRLSAADTAPQANESSVQVPATSHRGRRLANCGNRDCARLHVKEVRAYQYSCPAGTYPDDPDSIAAGNCKTCESGFWCPGGLLGSAASTYRNACPSGVTGGGPGQSTESDACTGCDAGTFSSGSGCVSCQSGNYCPEESTSQQPCPAGFVCSTPAAKTACPAGKFCPQSSTSAGSCPAGFQCTASTKTACPAGSYCPGGQNSAVQCPAGSYCPASASSQTACSDGELCPAGSSAAQSCPKGSYCIGGIGYDCPAGTFGTQTRLVSASQCTPCDAGTFGTSAGEDSQDAACDACPEGTGSAQGKTGCYPLLVSAEASDPGSVATGFTALDRLDLRFGADPADPADPTARLPLTGTSTHGVGVYSAFVFWSFDPADTDLVHCSSNDPVALAAALAAASAVRAGSAPTRAQTTPLLGDALTQLEASWLDAEPTLRIEVKDPNGVDAGLIPVGTNSLYVFPVEGALVSGRDASSNNTLGTGNQVAIGGTWGVATKPAVVSAVIRDTGRHEGLGVGDSIELQFNQELAGKRLSLVTSPGGAAEGARSVIELWPEGAAAPLSDWEGTAFWASRPGSVETRATVSGDLPAGFPAANSSVIVVNITSAPDWTAMAPSVAAGLLSGRIRVAIRRSAGLGGTGLMAQLGPANNTVTTSGSWGEAPATPVFRSHSAASGLLSWRPPHRPSAMTAAAWAELGLDGFVVVWCDAGAVGEAPTKAQEKAGEASIRGFFHDAVAAARAAMPRGTADAAAVDALLSAGRCSAAFHAMPRTDIELLSELWLPLLPTASVPVAPNTRLVAGVAAVFSDVMGQLVPAVDVSPTVAARASLGRGNEADVPTDGTALPRTLCFELDWTASAAASTPPRACTPSHNDVADARRRCRCKADTTVGAPGAGLAHTMGALSGSAMLRTEPLVVDGVHTASELSTAGDEFFTVIGDGMPVTTPGAALASDHASTLSSSLNAAMSQLAARASRAKNPIFRAHQAMRTAGTVDPAAASPTPYVTVAYGGGWGGGTYPVDVSQCTVFAEGLALRCLSVEGVGAMHTVNVTVNGRMPVAPITALSQASGVAARSEASLSQLSANATMKYAAPYIQEFAVLGLDGEAADTTPTEGGVAVELIGRHLGPLGHPHINDVRFSPSRHGGFQYVARNCSIVRAHTVMRCIAPENAGARAYWTARIALQESLLPSTSAEKPALKSIELVTAAMLVPSSQGVVDAAARVLGVGNTTGADPSAVAAAFAQLPAAPSKDAIPTGGGPLVLLHGSDLAADAGFLSAVWAQRTSNARLDIFSQEVDDPAAAPAAPACAMAAPHTAILCRVPPGAGKGFLWYAQILDQVSNGVAGTGYGAVEITSVDPVELPSEGGTVTVTGRNFPPVGDVSALTVTFKGGQITRFTRDQERPLEQLTFTAPPVVVRQPVVGPNTTEPSGPQGVVFVQVSLEAAGATAKHQLPIMPPMISSFNADSRLRNVTASAHHPPPTVAGGRSGAILLEVYGSSFGGNQGSLSLTLDGQPCLELSEEEIAQHLLLGRPHNAHLEFFCWTPLRRGVPAMRDVAERSFLSGTEYNFDALKRPPQITSIFVFGNFTPGATTALRQPLDTLGQEVLRVRGNSLMDVTLVELAILADGVDVALEVGPGDVLTASECTILPRYPTLAATGVDPCPTFPLVAKEVPNLCTSDSEILCRSPAGVGAGLSAHAVIQSAAAAVHGWSQPGVTSYRPPRLDAVHPAGAPTRGGDTIVISGRHFGIEALPRGPGTGLDAVEVTLGGKPCAVSAVNDTAIACTTPPGVDPDARLAVVVQGQQGLSGATSQAFLPFAYDAPAVLSAETYDVAADGNPVADASPRTASGLLAASTRGAWVRVSGSSFGSAPVVDFVSLADPAAAPLPCVADASVRPAGSAPAHDVAWCFVSGASGSTFRLRLRARMAGSPSLGAEAPHSVSFVFRPAVIQRIYFDSLADTEVGGRARDLRTSGEGRSPTSGGFLIHVVGHSFSADARVLVGGSPCDVVAGRVSHAAPLSLGSVEVAGERAREADYTSVRLDASALRGPAGPATALRPPLEVLDADGEQRRWLSHELASCLVPPGTGTVDVVVTSGGRNASAPVPLTYDPPAVSAVASPVIQAHVDGRSPPDVTITGLNFGALASELGAAGGVLVNVTARRVLPFDAGTAEVGPSPLHRLLAVSPPRSAPVTAPDVLCALPLMRSPHREIVCSPVTRIPVGLLAVRVTVAGQGSQDRLLLALCPAGTYGGPGELCRACPAEAFCAGGFAEPQPLAGFFKLRPAAFLECNPRDACPGAASAGIVAQPFPTDRLSVGMWQPGFEGLARPSGTGSLRLAAGDASGAAAAARALQSAPAGGDGDDDNAPATAAVGAAGAWRPEAGASELPLSAGFSANGTLAQLLERYQDEARRVVADQCVTGYQGERCASCQERFYRLEGRCEACPELAWLMIPGFICLLLALLGVGLFLQKKHVQLAGLSVGVDMLQILSIFAALDLNWPLEIRTVWTTVSMTTFSLQILAPECSIKVDYADKFFAVAAIPPVLALGCVALIVADLLRRVCLKRVVAACRACGCRKGKPGVAAASRPKDHAAGMRSATPRHQSSRPSIVIHSAASGARSGARLSMASGMQQGRDIVKLLGKSAHAADAPPKRGSTAAALDAGLGLALTLLYFVYLTATRNALQPLDCTTVDAADGSGLQSVMQLEPSVACDVKTDATYARVLPWAIITLAAYGIGIPVVFAIVLFLNRRSIVADQTLLASGEGHSPDTNPHFATRKRYGRLYADYKPEAYWWRLVLTVRKALVAVVSILFTQTPVFAASSTALVLFVSFLMHSRYQPFLQAPPVSKRFLALAGPEEGAEEKVGAKGGKPSRAGAVAPGVAPARCGFVSLPPGLVACLRNTSPVFAVCLSAKRDRSAARSTSSPNLDILSSGSKQAKRKRSIFRRPAKLDTPLPPKGPQNKSVLEFAAAAAAALEAQAKEDARKAAKIARSSSLSFVFDYNTLEGSFLITGVLVLMGGLAFSSNAITPGSVPYYIVVGGIILLVGGAVLSFSWVLAFELYRALRFADVLTKARQYQDTVLARADEAKRAAAKLTAYRSSTASSNPLASGGLVASKLRASARRAGKSLGRAETADTATAAPCPLRLDERPTFKGRARDSKANPGRG